MHVVLRQVPVNIYIYTRIYICVCVKIGKHQGGGGISATCGPRQRSPVPSELRAGTLYNNKCAHAHALHSMYKTHTIYKHIYTYIHVQIYMYVHIHIHTYMYIYVYVFVHKDTYVSTHTHARTRVRMYVRIVPDEKNTTWYVTHGGRTGRAGRSARVNRVQVRLLWRSRGWSGRARRARVCRACVVTNNVMGMARDGI